VGLVEAVLAVRAARSRTAGQPAPLLVASFVIYIVIAVVALSPTLIRRMGATPLMVEGILLAGLVLLGAALAWTQLVASAERSAAGR
jgi:hypothetical protein